MMIGLKNNDGNIIIPEQTHALLKGIKNGGKKKEKISPSPSNALEVFNKESQPSKSISPA